MMIERGKFRSLTLINWNGFFARTFELDELVTTLSGGNGAGKSTTMAAFVTALIPDLTLLHFRNTTEAGATTGSRDKGLFGKLRPGVCYVLLDMINSRHQRIICGVRLQQVAGRDRKVDIKPFMLQGLPTVFVPSQIVTEALNDRQARILTLQELKERVDEIENVQFKQFNSISDYHAVMFDLGLIPKRLRSSADRSKFYRLIEASLYGGISSAITRSLRDYLLPENSGVRKAFQDMESALRENRMTLDAIKITQSERELFKHLISEATAYVAADYMRHANERRLRIEQALTIRNELLSHYQHIKDEQVRHVNMTQELQEIKEKEDDLETDYQSANDYLSLVQTAIRQQEKIDRYQAELEELSYRLEEQNQIVAETAELLAEKEMRYEVANQEVDEIKSQLADYQQALDVQQTRSIQYQQAIDALDKAREYCSLPELTENDAAIWLENFRKREVESTESLLLLEQRVNILQTAQGQFEQAYQLVKQLSGDVARDQAWQKARNLLRDWSNQLHMADRIQPLRTHLLELEQRLNQQQEAKQIFTRFVKLASHDYQLDELEQAESAFQQQMDVIIGQNEQLSEQRLNLLQEQMQINQHSKILAEKAPAWFVAQDMLLQLSKQSGCELLDSQSVMAQIQHLLEKERALSLQRDEIQQHKHEVEEQIERLNQPSGADDSRLLMLAEKLNGVLLSEIYEDVTLEDAPYFSALYGPARHAIVISDLAAIREQLDNLDDVPEDFYLIEGDPQSFDDSVFDIEELKNAVIVKVSERQWRYSHFPATPVFGSAAREKRLDTLRQEKEKLAEHYAALSFDVQKIQRLQQTFSQFVGSHLSIAFDNDPEAEIQQYNQRRNEIERLLTDYQNKEQQYHQQIERIKETVTLLHRLHPHIHLLQDKTLLARVEDVREELEKAKEAQQYIQKYNAQLVKLDVIANALQSDPDQQEALMIDYQQAQEKQRLLKQQTFALSEVVQRRSHFSYSDSAGILIEDSDLNEQLRQRLAYSEAARSQAREGLRQQQTQYNQVNELCASLKSAFNTRQDMLKELKNDLSVTGVRADSESETRARLRREELHTALSNNRLRLTQLAKQLTICETEIEASQKRIRKTERDYQQIRQLVVQIKAGWCNVLRLVKDNGVERRLHRRELAYLDAEALRSMSDKALGALRLAVADNEHLRDVLRMSEDPKNPEKKIQFYIEVYRHLRERIRQDIIHTDDPIEAIEQMEIELSRLTEELNSREKILAISAKSVASIIRKTIQREQNRIRALNQGLQSVSFGQVNSVRLNVNIRETHTLLLDILADQQDQHQDLFNSQHLTFSEALAKLYQRLNPQIDMGQRTPQTIGEELLDYRSYLELDVEVSRGADGWLRAESGALSTGEAIGTGMSILVMVIQSWEDESRRIRGKDIAPCRLLFLDEAARLDAKSIATLFELCERLEMQLLIAAPENISPEKGTTYKLVRKIFGRQEHVHVVGLRGFAESEMIEEKAAIA